MATTKAFDLAVKVGEYEQNGEKKNRYKNIGTVLVNEDGRQYIALDSTIVTMELQYIANPKRSERILVSMFEVREQGGGSKPAAQSAAPKKESAPANGGFDQMSDDIPF